MSNLVQTAQNLAAAIQAGSKSTVSTAEMQDWSNQIYQAYDQNPNSPDVKKCQEILFPVLIMMVIMVAS